MNLIFTPALLCLAIALVLLFSSYNPFARQHPSVLEVLDSQTQTRQLEAGQPMKPLSTHTAPIITVTASAPNSSSMESMAALSFDRPLLPPFSIAMAASAPRFAAKCLPAPHSHRFISAFPSARRFPPQKPHRLSRPAYKLHPLISLVREYARCGAPMFSNTITKNILSDACSRGRRRALQLIGNTLPGSSASFIAASSGDIRRAGPTVSGSPQG
jgi:hypothetical protein